MSAQWKSVLGSPPLIAALAGGLLLAGSDEVGVALSAGFGLFGLCEALRRCHSRRLAILSGWLFGAVANAVALASLGPLLMAYAHLSAPWAWTVAALLWLAQGAPYALAAYLAEASVRRGWPRWLSLASSLTVALALCPQVLPWHLASTQIAFLPYAQIAELGGESLLGFCFVALVASLHGSLRARGKALVGTLAVALVALALPLTYGLLRLPAVEHARAIAPKLKLGVVQANAPLPSEDYEAYARASLATLRALTRPLEAAGARLTIWGEAAYPYPLLRNSVYAPEDVRAPLAEGVHGPLLLGLETYTSFIDNSAKYNSAWLLHRDGRLGGRIDKTRLIPFAEYVPFWRVFAPLQRFFQSPGFSAGAPGTVRSDAGPLGVLICYEDLFASAARATVREGARVLLNLTNDVWFGHSRVSFLHDMIARLRAIEQRRDLVRVVNTGLSSFTSASGRQLMHAAAFTQASFIVEPALLDARTPYSMLGDLTAPACALGLLLALGKRLKTRSAS